MIPELFAARYAVSSVLDQQLGQSQNFFFVFFALQRNIE
jgi:hypothetical protein